jgi:hypothetical protein
MGQATYVLRDTEACVRNCCCRGKMISITYSECVSVDLVIQHIKCMHRIVSSSVASSAVPYFCILPDEVTIFGVVGKCTENNICVLISSTNFVRKHCHSEGI